MSIHYMNCSMRSAGLPVAWVAWMNDAMSQVVQLREAFCRVSNALGEYLCLCIAPLLFRLQLGIG
jgi:hypothetical protein